jgi:hypothetical protein
MPATTLSVPAKIQELALSRKGEVLRLDVGLAQREMLKLGISANSEFFAFFSEYQAVNLYSTVSYETLCDVSEPTAQIAEGTAFVHEVWALPSEFVCITSCEGEGCYLYSTRTEAVYDFSLAARDDFIRNPIPSWRTFFEFAEWFLSPSEVTNER